MRFLMETAETLLVIAAALGVTVGIVIVLTYLSMSMDRNRP